MPMLKYFSNPGLSRGAAEAVRTKVNNIAKNVDVINTELCYYINLSSDLTEGESLKLEWILSTPFKEKQLMRQSSFQSDGDSKHMLIEIGPRLNFSTPFATNAVSICKSIGLKQITRIEASVRYQIIFTDSKPSGDLEERLVQSLHDRMTQCRYMTPIESFDLEVKSEPLFEVKIMEEGRAALEKANKDLGLAFDDWDLDFYTKLFTEKIQRNPTSVECFDLAQSNSEHSRHWFFRGKLIIDGEEMSASLFKMIMATQDGSNDNNIIKFNDNSSGIQGYEVMVYKPSDPTEPSQMTEVRKEMRHIIFTAETHNFPTGVAPFPGATTGTGGRIRDVHCTGRGAHVVAGTAGYCFGNLSIPGYDLPWEDKTFKYPSNFAPALDIAIQASNGASDYGNKFGEPVLAGFARSFGLEIMPGDRREYIKPIMFSGGIGQLEGSHILKEIPVKGMEVAKVGGPVYRIGVGGGAASSVQVQGDNKTELDFGAVQRGDAEMEQKLNRVIRGCIELGLKNPIASIHDQGAGGNGNVLKEIVEPAGAIIRAADFQLGDPTLSIMELWGAEYQETNAILLARENMETLTKIGNRERCPVCFVGTVTGDGKIRLEDFSQSTNKRLGEESESINVKRRKTMQDYTSKESAENGGALETQESGDGCESKLANGGAQNGHVTEETTNEKCVKQTKYPVDLELDHVLGKMPQKEFQFERIPLDLRPLKLPDGLMVREALERVMRLPAVASKRYLTNKVDRCVTGLVAQQQCVGPLHIPLADVAVTALSYIEKRGSATAIGEQPIKCLIDPASGARMSVGEALTNLVFAKVSDLKDVKCSGNWMWPAKLPGEGATLVDACKAMCDVMGCLGVAVDGGKDSLSMAARFGEETIKAPGTLVISAYVGCPDITLTVTPDLKCPSGRGFLLYVDIERGKNRLGGSALAQCYKQIGNQSPDLDHPEALAAAFRVTQKLIAARKISAGHDVSDGGLVTSMMEMAFAGNCGIDVSINTDDGCGTLDVLFAEELGLVLEVDKGNMDEVLQAYAAENVSCYLIGHSEPCDQNSLIKIQINNTAVLEEKMVVLRDVWEETSFQLENLQSNPACVKQEQEGLKHRRAPPYKLTFDPDIVHIIPKGKTCPKVAVLREEGSNSDREMAAALIMAGFEVWDVNMQDLCTGSITLDRFHGLVFVGGFSYADVLGSAKGWAATAKFNTSIQTQLKEFKDRQDTFSFGVCNGCQLMALLGWVSPEKDGGGDSEKPGVYLDHNDSERFECRFVTVKVSESPAIMLKGMSGTVFGMWSAHGEGKMVFKSPIIFQDLSEKGLVPVQYVDDDGEPTTVYPFNPNGSPGGAAALCSQDGRHLAIMPHPERCFLPWQCPWMPQDMGESLAASPWLQMFQNAFDWSIQQINPDT